jgi:hypothetical protein
MQQIGRQFDRALAAGFRAVKMEVLLQNSCLASERAVVCWAMI